MDTYYNAYNQWINFLCLFNANFRLSRHSGNFAPSTNLLLSGDSHLQSPSIGSFFLLAIAASDPHTHMHIEPNRNQPFSSTASSDEINTDPRSHNSRRTYTRAQLIIIGLSHKTRVNRLTRKRIFNYHLWVPASSKIKLISYFSLICMLQILYGYLIGYLAISHYQCMHSQKCKYIKKMIRLIAENI